MAISTRRAVFALSALLLGATALTAQPHRVQTRFIFPSEFITAERTCADARPGEVACMAMRPSGISADSVSAFAPAGDLRAMLPIVPKGLAPEDLRRAYSIPDGGAGQTVALIDAYDDPLAEADLAVYRAQFHLPPCTTQNGCFHKYAQDGSTNYPEPNRGWAGEISLDIEMASAICPACNIMLIETKSSALSDMAIAVNTAVALKAIAVSNSYGGREFPDEIAFEENYNHPGVIMTASAGDSGFGAQFPASSRYVVSVGGTDLQPSAENKRGFVETAWPGTGSGCSMYEPKPAWQHDSACANRTANDIAFVASQNSPVAVYESYCSTASCGWIQYSGTSVGAPAVAAMYAVAATSKRRSFTAESLYRARRKTLYDITAGSNGVCPAEKLCTAASGYDAPSGNGSPNGIAALR